MAPHIYVLHNEKPTPFNLIGSMMIIRVLPIHVPARTRATFPTHKKSHNPHPQGGGGEGVKMGTLHWGGVGGGLAKPGSYIRYKKDDDNPYQWPKING